MINCQGMPWRHPKVTFHPVLETPGLDSVYASCCFTWRVPPEDPKPVGAWWISCLGGSPYMFGAFEHGLVDHS